MADKLSLSRFKEAQGYGVYERALAEIRNGRKMSHWMWFIFPQIVGLGHSHTTFYYAIKSAEEARDYLEDTVLGPRLREICAALLELPATDPVEIFGTPDWMKLRSSMTLFDHISPDDIFDKVLAKYFAARRDPLTLSILRTLPTR